MKSSSGVMRNGWRCSPKKSRYMMTSLECSGHSQNLLGTEGLLIWPIGSEALADGAKPEVLHKPFQTRFTLVQIGVVTEPGEPACVVKSGLPGINFPWVEVEHLRPLAVTRGVIEQGSEHGVGKLPEIATARCRNRHPEHPGSGQRELLQYRTVLGPDAVGRTW